MRLKWMGCWLLMGVAAAASAQGTVPVFQKTVAGQVFTLAGGDPLVNATTHIAVTLVPVSLSFPDFPGAVKTLDARADVAAVMGSPIFRSTAFPPGGATQYTNALLQAAAGGAAQGHTVLDAPAVKPIAITVTPGHGYLLSSRKYGGRLAVVDVQFVQKEIFRQLGPQKDRLVLAVTHNATFFAEADDTICCSTGTHGVDRGTGTSFVLGSYFRNTPSIVQEQDVQPLSQQLAEFFLDPLHDPLSAGNVPTGNVLGSGWQMPGGGCGGRGVGSSYFLLEPVNTNHKNNLPVSSAFTVGRFHLANVALPAWYTSASGAYSFPDKKALATPAKVCAARATGAVPLTATPEPNPGKAAGRLIGYWNGAPGFRMRDIAPQWDIVIEAFAVPDHTAPEGSLRFAPPRGSTPDELKADIAEMKSRGKKIMISLGGGGQFFSLVAPGSVDTFVHSVSSIVSEYGFDGVDIDFETPSMDLDSGDRDFRHPTTPSIVHLIAGLRQLHDHFGAGFMISLVPEGTQFPAAAVTYGGEFGTYLPLAWGLRDILSFVDVQDYNTPPLQGLDGEIYQAATADYHAAMTELLLHGFAVAGDPKRMFPPLPADKVAVGLLTGYEDVSTMRDGVSYLKTGVQPANASYRLRRRAGYPNLMGAMYWTIDGDRKEEYRYSNVVGPLVHAAEKPQEHAAGKPLEHRR